MRPTFFKHDMTSRAETKAARRVETERLWREVVHKVNARDKFRCRVCGRLAKVPHHHHVQYRSAGGADSTRNVVTLCELCHSLEHLHKLAVDGDGDAGITVSMRDESGRWFVAKEEIAPGQWRKAD